MRSRVRSLFGKRRAVPACFRRIVACALTDKHQPGGLSRLSSQLQPPTREERQRLVWLGNHQPDRARAQGFLDGPKQIDLIFRADNMQSLPDTVGQATQHRQMWRMGRKHPDQRSRMPCRLKEGKGAATKPFSFMHPPGGQCERFEWCGIKPHLRAHLWRRV